MDGASGEIFNRRKSQIKFQFQHPKKVLDARTYYSVSLTLFSVYSDTLELDKIIVWKLFAHQVEKSDVHGNESHLSENGVTKLTKIKKLNFLIFKI